MEWTVLGNCGPFPTPEAGTSGYFFASGDTRLQLDLGCGTLMRLTGLFPPERLDALVLTHWHYDHCSDVLPLIYRLEALGACLKVFGPVDESSLVRQEVQRRSCFELIDLRPGEEVTVGGVRLRAFAAAHPVPALMLRLEAEGRVLCYTGDTNQTEGLADFVRGADLLLADGLFPAEQWTEKKPHLSALLAAQLAAAQGVKRLVLTHFNPFFDQETLLREARSAFPSVELSRPGQRYTL